MNGSECQIGQHWAVINVITHALQIGNLLTSQNLSLLALRRWTIVFSSKNHLKTRRNISKVLCWRIRTQQSASKGTLNKVETQVTWLYNYAAVQNTSVVCDDVRLWTLRLRMGDTPSICSICHSLVLLQSQFRPVGCQCVWSWEEMYLVISHFKFLPEMGMLRFKRDYSCENNLMS